MNLISGEKFQELTDLSISKKEHKKLENTSIANSINIDSFDFSNFDNPSFIYANSSLINLHKKVLTESKFYDKLAQFKNPFYLLLHNSDQSFEKEHLKIFEISKCEKIFSQNVAVKDPRVIPLPIGIGNTCWPYSKFVPNTCEKTRDIFFNFTITGGNRKIKRPACFERLNELGVEWIDLVDQLDYPELVSKYKYVISPEGNGIDCHRTWETLYNKSIPVVDRSYTTEYFAKYFPMVLVDDWNTFELSQLNGVYETASWVNYYLLDFDLFVKKFVG